MSQVIRGYGGSGVQPPKLASEFNEDDYNRYKHLPGMPQEIPEITPVHWMCMIIPTILLLMLYIHHRDAAVKDYEEEQEKTQNLEMLIVVGMLFGSFVVLVQLQIIPPSFIRALGYYKWKQSEPLPPIMKILIVGCLFAFIIYPSIMFLKRKKPEEPAPKVHKLVAPGVN